MNGSRIPGGAGIPIFTKTSVGTAPPLVSTCTSDPILMVGNAVTFACTLIASTPMMRLAFSIEISYDRGRTWETTVGTNTLAAPGYATTTVLNDRAGLVRGTLLVKGVNSFALVDGWLTFTQQ